SAKKLPTAVQALAAAHEAPLNPIDAGLSVVWIACLLPFQRSARERWGTRLQPWWRSRRPPWNTACVAPAGLGVFCAVPLVLHRSARLSVSKLALTALPTAVHAVEALQDTPFITTRQRYTTPRSGWRRWRPRGAASSGWTSSCRSRLRPEAGWGNQK